MDKIPTEYQAMPFQSGQSGNPAGRPPGARNKGNRAMEPVFQANGEAIIERLVEHAKAANPVALRLCVNTVAPALAPIHASLADGDISSGEAADLLRVADISARMLRELDTAPNRLA